MSSEPLMEQWVQPEQGDGYGRRILVDGTVEERTSMTATFEHGELVYEPQISKWREVGRCEPEVQRMLEDAIRSSGLLEVGEAPPLPGTAVAKARLTWTVALEGRRNELALTDAHVLADPRLTTVNEAFQLAFGHSTARR